MSQSQMYFGSLHWVVNAGGQTATTTVANTPKKAAGATNGNNCNGFSHSDNRLTYEGPEGRTFLVNVAYSVSASGATNSTMHLAKNDTPAVSGIQRKIGTGGDIGAGAGSVLVTMKRGDYVELWVETDDGDDLTIERAVMTVTVAG